MQFVGWVVMLLSNKNKLGPGLYAPAIGVEIYSCFKQPREAPLAMHLHTTYNVPPRSFAL